ncbi:MAG TPA: phenylalanine--tRNA ligase subunit alpha, partial [Ruminococcaceae bacterium]|nr:phenylalanine--tRNA ligase subunit alpha [Oscillospiraceae bacterium]
MKEKLEAIRSLAERELREAGDRQALENLRIRYLGKKGELTAILKQMGALSAEERPAVGRLANQIRAHIEGELTARAAEIRSMETARRLEKEKIDVTLPGRRHELGHKHPLSIELDEIKEIFV